MLISNCNRCDLCITRNKIVSGIPIDNPKFMFVGEAPGYTEDKTGIPFTGLSGQLLQRYIIDYNLANYSYITNVVKCRPPKNRTPTDYEMRRCAANLAAEIILYKPKVLVCVGATALLFILRGCDSLSKVRGKFIKLTSNSYVFPIYHPAYILRINDESTYKKDFELLNKLL